MAWQKTIRSPVSTSGVGIHGGEQVNLTLRPAPAGTGIVFVRKDMGIAIPARAENARDQSYATTLHGARREGTDRRAPDGRPRGGRASPTSTSTSTAPRYRSWTARRCRSSQMLRRAGVLEQGVSLPEVRVRKPIRVGDRERWIELRPAAELLGRLPGELRLAGRRAAALRRRC